MKLLFLSLGLTAITATASAAERLALTDLCNAKSELSIQYRSALDSQFEALKNQAIERGKRHLIDNVKITEAFMSVSPYWRYRTNDQSQMIDVERAVYRIFRNTGCDTKSADETICETWRPDGITISRRLLLSSRGLSIATTESHLLPSDDTKLNPIAAWRETTVQFTTETKIDLLTQHLDEHHYSFALADAQRAAVPFSLGFLIKPWQLVSSMKNRAVTTYAWYRVGTAQEIAQSKQEYLNSNLPLSCAAATVARPATIKIPATTNGPAKSQPSAPAKALPAPQNTDVDDDGQVIYRAKPTPDDMTEDGSTPIILNRTPAPKAEDEPF